MANARTSDVAPKGVGACHRRAVPRRGRRRRGRRAVYRAGRTELTLRLGLEPPPAVVSALRRPRRARAPTRSTTPPRSSRRCARRGRHPGRRRAPRSASTPTRRSALPASARRTALGRVLGVADGKMPPRLARLPGWLLSTPPDVTTTPVHEPVPSQTGFEFRPGLGAANAPSAPPTTLAGRAWKVQADSPRRRRRLGTRSGGVDTPTAAHRQRDGRRTGPRSETLPWRTAFDGRNSATRNCCALVWRGPRLCTSLYLCDGRTSETFRAIENSACCRGTFRNRIAEVLASSSNWPPVSALIASLPVIYVARVRPRFSVCSWTLFTQNTAS